MKQLLVTGSSGLIGSEVVTHFCQAGWRVHGLDNNMSANFFGPGGDTRWNQKRPLDTFASFAHHEIDIRNRSTVLDMVRTIHPNAIIHTAAQPSHDLAASRPFDNFDVNAVGTLNLLETARLTCPESPFIHMSTNKVHGDRPNTIDLKELETRWDYADPQYTNGIREEFPIDQSKHSIFGASKVAADVMVQEYGRYFGMPTCALRGGCLTGPNHSGVELHGFLSYLIKCNLEGRSTRSSVTRASRCATTSTQAMSSPSCSTSSIPRDKVRSITSEADALTAFPSSKPLTSSLPFPAVKCTTNTWTKPGPETTFVTSPISPRSKHTTPHGR
jgi:CDP-paratose 2-epimerase